jgi:hypothetical protein
MAEDVTRLPKWAQDRIHYAEARAVAAEKTLLAFGQPNSPFRVQAYTGPKSTPSTIGIPGRW